MTETHTLLEGLIFWGIVGLVACGCVLSVLTYQRLRSRHAELYASLGSPGVLLTLPADARKRVSRFMWRGEYRGVADPYLKSLFGALRIIAVLAIALFAVGVLKVILGVKD